MRKILLSGLIIFLILASISNFVIAPETTCTDSDGGKNYYVKGTTTNPPPEYTSSWTDKCITSVTLQEGTCTEDLGVHTYECPNGCLEGACIPACTTNEECPPENEGEHYCKNSELRCIIKTSYSCIENECVVSGAGELCGTCPNGCLEGACLEKPGCTNDEECPSSMEYYCSGSYSCTRMKTYACMEGECVVAAEGGSCGPCPHGCEEGKCVEEECVGEGGSLGAVIPENTIECCEGLTPIRPATQDGDTCSVVLGSRGYCTYCGDGVCKEPENSCNCPGDCKYSGVCPVMIDLSFNKHDYYPGDYFEAVVKIYDNERKLMPNQAFSVYNQRQGTGSTYYTDSTGIWKEISKVPSTPEISGEWTFLASVNKEGCSYVSDKESIYIHVTDKCGDGFCDYNEREIVCDTLCAAELTTYTKTASIAPSVTGGMTIATPTLQAYEQIAEQEIISQPTSCESYCHVKCPKDCTPNCGNGVCDREVCEAEGCPVPENEKNCPQDCRKPNYCGSRSTDPNCICQEGYRKEVFESPCEPLKDIECPVENVLCAEGYVPQSYVAEDGCPHQKCILEPTVAVVPTTGMMTGTAEIVKIGYRNAYWQCYDGKEKYEDGTSCIAPETWKRHAEEFCSGHCNAYGKCGVNSFRLGGDCTIENECYDSDSGKNYYVKGYVKYQDDATWDSCESDGIIVNERYCCDNLEASITCTATYRCPNGCLDGACVKEMRICRYYRCVTAYKDLYLSTDKYSYDLNEPVEIRTNSFPEEYIGIREIKVSVTDPYGEQQPVMLNAVCETGGGVCPECKPGYYCAPCTTKTVCYFKGTYTDTGSVGIYQAGRWVETGDFMIHPMSFRVYDESLLGRYLILSDIDGYAYKDSQLSPGPENVMGYMAHYVKDGRDYAVIVADFENREGLEEFLKNAMGQIVPREKQIDGYYVYVFESYGQKIYIWTYKTILVGVTEYAPYVVATRVASAPVPVEVPAKQETTEAIPMQEQEVLGTPQEAPGLLTGMITGMPIAEATPLYCGMDSLHADCVCRADEVKEEFTPQCLSPPCETHYRCRIKEPSELINAYLDKYPSDIKATGTECEGKGGYCIDAGSSCRQGFEETGFACKTSAEKCCIREVDRDDFLEIVMKLEGIRVSMDSLERRARALSEYYESVGDEDRSGKFSDVAEMFAKAKGMVDDIVAKIRANLDDLEGIRAEIKGDINELRTYISSILERMVS